MGTSLFFDVNTLQHVDFNYQQGFTGPEKMLRLKFCKLKRLLCYKVIQ